MMTKGIPARSRYLLDEDFYRRKYSLPADEDAFNHFLKVGFKSDFNPNPVINIRYVKDNYEIKTFMELVSFIENSEGNPSQYFDVEFYYDKYDDVKAAGVPAVKHFMRNGRREGRQFSSMHNYTYNELIEIEASGSQGGEVYLKELKKMAESEGDIELLPFEDQWDNSYALKHKYAIRSNKKIDKRARDDDFFDRKCIVVIGDLSIPQCKKYRIMQKMEYFRKNDIKHSFSHWLDVPRSLNLIQTASTVIFYRIPHTKLVSSYIDECMRLGIRFGYDIDDPVFDLRIYSANVNLNFITPKEKQSILSGVDSYASIIRQMEFVITSTPAMRSHLSDLTSKDIYIWRNIIDSETLNAHYIYQQTIGGEKRQTDPNKFIIKYASGSRAHEADFSMAIEALHQILDEYSHVHLEVIGYCAMSAKLKMRFPNQVNHTDFKDYVTYIGDMGDADLNIIPLVQDDFNDCKSAIRYLEASVVKVPTMVTAIGDFVNLIDNRVNGILINKSSDWYENLKAAVNGKYDLEKMANHAHESVMSNQTIAVIGDKLDNQLKELIL